MYPCPQAPKITSTMLKNQIYYNSKTLSLNGSKNREEKINFRSREREIIEL
jgi:hypothetical protein